MNVRDHIGTQIKIEENFVPEKKNNEQDFLRIPGNKS